MFLWTADNNIHSEAVKQYWQRSVYLLFLEVAFADMKSHFSQEKRSNYVRCRLIPKVVIGHNEKKTNQRNQCLTETGSCYTCTNILS